MPPPHFPHTLVRTLVRRVAMAVLLASAATAACTQPAQRIPLLRYSVPVPAQWQAQRPASSFRLAQFRVPAAAGAADAEVVVFHFGAGQGGSAAANIARWTSQVTGPDGRPASPKVETFQVGSVPVTLAELGGTYARALGGVPSAPRPDQTLLAAVVEAPEGNVIFQLHGDRPTVDAHRAAFLAMVRGWKD